MSRFQLGDRVEWVSRSGIRREGVVVEEMPGKQWVVRPDGCRVERVVDADDLSRAVPAPEPGPPSRRRPPGSAAGRKGGLTAAANMTAEQRRERASKAGLAKMRRWRLKTHYFDVRATRRSPWGLVEQVQLGRHDGRKMGWREVWEVLALHRPGCWALQVFPDADHLIDEVDCYHLWVLPSGVVPEPLTLNEPAEATA